MQTETASRPKPEPPSFPVSEEDYRQWIRRFDLLWSSATSEHDQREMKTLIRLIEQYEAARIPANNFFGNLRNQGEIS
jgi:hypothetical protein